MKSAYELAMERLEKDAPTVALSEEQKSKIAEIEDKFKAKIAALELSLQDSVAAVQAGGDPSALLQAETEQAAEIASLKEKCEAEKAAARES